MIEPPRERRAPAGAPTAAGLAALFGVVAGAVDFALSSSTIYESNWIWFQYLAGAAALQGVMTLPFSLAAWLLHRWADRDSTAAVIAAPTAAVLLPICLRLGAWAHDELLPRAEVTSPVGLAVTGMILAGAAVVGWFGPRRLARLPGRSGGVRSARWAAIAGFVLLVASLSVFAPRPQGATRTTRPNVLLICIDSVRADIWNRYTSGPTTDPLARLLSESRRFSNAYTTYSSSLPSHGSMFSGLYPTEHGALGQRLVENSETGMVINSDLELMAERFSDEGYETAGIMQNAWLGPPWGLEAGFATYFNGGKTLRVGMFSPLLALSTSIVGPYAYFAAKRWSRAAPSRHPNTNLFRSWLARRDASRPFFCFLHYMDLHVPHDPPRAFAGSIESGPFAGKSGSHMKRLIEAGQVSPEDMPAALDHLRALNLATLAWVDRILAPALEAMRESGLLDTTLVILTSDHGDNLYEKVDDYGHTHVFDTATRIPLAIRAPDSNGVAEQSEATFLASLVDVPRTAYAYARVAPPEPIRGIDLLSTPKSPRSIFLQGWDARHGYWAHALRTDEFKLIVLPEGEYRLYDMRADPREWEDLAPSRPEVVAQLAAEFEQGRSEMLATSSEMIDAEDLPNDVAKELRALGYIE